MTLEDNCPVPTNWDPSNNHLPICPLWRLRTHLKHLQQVRYPADDELRAPRLGGH
jgi:hypothetical protein